jgi:hypothetical protein
VEPLTLREENRLKAFANRVLRKKSVFNKEEETGEWRPLHDEELYDLSSSTNIIRVMR